MPPPRGAARGCCRAAGGGRPGRRTRSADDRRLADARFIVKSFHAAQGHWPRLLQPRGLNDHATRRILFSHAARGTICCDKLAMRRFAAERLGEDLAPPLLAVVETAAALPW